MPHWTNEPQAGGIEAVVREPVPNGVSRRQFGALAGGALAFVAFGGACHGSEARQERDGRVAVRPRAAVKTSITGTQRLGLGGERDAILRVPANAPDGPLPLLVLFHGAGGSAEGIVGRLGATADEAAVAVLAPDSRGSTWDAIRGGFGPDVAFLGRALARVFDLVAVDPERTCAGGFSDGATYALSVALINGTLFRRALAFSPGFVIGGPAQGKPGVFISHGTADRILPIDRCSRAIVPMLQRRGYDVTYREFNGGHTVPQEIAREGLQWMASTAESGR